MGGQPFPDGEEPDDRNRGEADEEFASVVFDEDFVRAAEVHEPTAVERILAAAQSHPEGEPPRPYEEGYGYGPGGEGEFEPGYEYGPDEDGRFGPFPYAHPEHGRGRGTTHGYGGAYPYGPGGPYGRGHGRDDLDDPDGPYDSDDDLVRPYRGHARWQRPIAWVLAVVMGIGVVALAFTAVYRGASGQRQEPSPPPASSGVESPADDERLLPGSLPARSPGVTAPTATAEAGPG